MSDRASQINLARVYMAQARATPHRSFAFTLIEWAGAARRRAAGRELFADPVDDADADDECAPVLIGTENQMELFA